MDRVGGNLAWWSRAWPLAVLLFVAVCYATVARLPFDRVERAVEFPYQLDGEEGFLLAQAMRLAHGQGLYGSLAHPPYVVDNYPPLYPAVWSVWLRVTGGGGEPSLAAGRVLAALGAVVAALLVGALVAGATLAGGAHRLQAGRPHHNDCGAGVPPAKPSTVAQTASVGLGPRDWWRVAVAGLLAWACAVQFLTEYAVVRWMAYARVDLPAVALSLAGLALFAWQGRRTDAGGARARLAAAVLMALGLLTKQTVLAAPVACVLWLLAARRPRDAVRMAAWLALAVGVPTLLLLAATRGDYWRHTVTYNRNVMNWHELVSVWVPHLWRFHAPGIVAMALLFLWAAVRIATGTREERRPKVGQASCLSAQAQERSGEESGETPVPPSCTDETGKMPVLLSDGGEPVLSLLTIYGALNVLFLAAIAKAGSAENYLIEPAAAVIAFVGVAMGRLLTGRASERPGGSDSVEPAKPARRAAHAVFVAMVAALLVAQAVRYTPVGTAIYKPVARAVKSVAGAMRFTRLGAVWPFRPALEFVARPSRPGPSLRFDAALAAASGAAPTVEALVQGDRVVRWLHGLPGGPVLCEDPIYLLRAGRPVYFQNFIMTQLAAEGKWDETPVVQAAAEGRIVGIVAHQDLMHEKEGDFSDRWSPALRAAIRAADRPLAQPGSPQSGPSLFLYEPGPPVAPAVRPER